MRKDGRKIEYWCANCDKPLDTSTAFNHEFEDQYYCPPCFDLHVVGEDK